MQGEKVMSPTILHKACGHTLAVARPHTLSLALPPACFAIVSNTCIRELTLCFFQVDTRAQGDWIYEDTIQQTHLSYWIPLVIDFYVERSRVT